MTSTFLKAKEAGYSDEEILEYLKTQPKYSNFINKAKENGYSNEELISHFNQPKEKERFPPIKETFTKNLQNINRDIAKGVVGGVTKLGRMMGPLESNKKEQSQKEVLEEVLPSEKSFIGSSLRKGLELAPSVLGFPGGGAISNLPKSILAGFLGEGAKELGAPEWAQTAAELTAYIGPDITKKLLASGKDKDLIQFMKQHGLTDKQITPLIQSDFKKRWLSKLSAKGESTKETLQSTKEGLGEIYQTIQTSPLAGKEIGELQNGKLINNIKTILEDLPRELQDKIFPDLQDLLNNKITGKSLMNFYKDLNSKYSIPKKQLQRLKEPVKNALSSISTELGKEFETVNHLYSKYADIASKLKPSISDELVKAAEFLGLGGGLIKGLFFGDFRYLQGILGENAFRKLAKNMLINPNYQQLSRKMTLALNANKPALAQKTMQEMQDLINKSDPEIASKLFSDQENIQK